MQKYHVLILAGSRPGGEPFAHEEGKTQKIYLEVAGKPLLQHTLDTLTSWSKTASIHINLPQESPLQEEAPKAFAHIKEHNIPLINTKKTPCTSLLYALANFEEALKKGEPVLILTADAPLLTHSILDEFTQQNAHEADFIAGVGYVKDVETAYPNVKRTRIRLRDGHIGGCNLFIVNNMQGLKVIEFWRTLEAHRKKPWRLAATFKMLFLYITGLLSAHQALKELGKKAGCTLKFAYLKNPHAAIDVDKSADLSLVRHIFAKEKAK